MRLLIGGTPTGTLKHISSQEYTAYCGGLLSWADGTSPRSIVALGAPFAVDNFAFTAFDPLQFERYLDKCAPHQSDCWWVVAPDVWSDASATMRLFHEWQPRIRARGYRVALAAQNGLEYLSVPWSDVDCLFVGGSDGWRSSAAMPALVREAQRRGKRTHWGRVNTASRLLMGRRLGFDSADGSSFARYRHKILEAMPVLTRSDVPLPPDAAQEPLF